MKFSLIIAFYTSGTRMSGFNYHFSASFSHSNPDWRADDGFSDYGCECNQDCDDSCDCNCHNSGDCECGEECNSDCECDCHDPDYDPDECECNSDCNSDCSCEECHNDGDEEDEEDGSDNTSSDEDEDMGPPRRAAAIRARENMAAASAQDAELRETIREGYGTSTGHWTHTKKGSERRY